jgi:hypothetical protein
VISEAGTEMSSEQTRWCAADVECALVERGWLRARDSRQADPRLDEWLDRAAELLGPHAKDRSALIARLEPVFSYDAAELVQRRESQTVLVRAGAREVIREIANQILTGGDVDSDRFKEIVEAVKLAVPYRSRAMFHPIRLALAGLAGEGELDRVILLLDSASKLHFAVPVKGVRERMLEFCAAFD